MRSKKRLGQSAWAGEPLLLVTVEAPSSLRICHPGINWRKRTWAVEQYHLGKGRQQEMSLRNIELQVAWSQPRLQRLKDELS